MIEIKVKNIIITIVVIVIILVLGWSFLVPEEWKNKGARMGITMQGGKFHITYTDDKVVKEWDMKGKVTSDPKGYYFFWVDGKYVQTPINRTVIEER